jgi:hypothetical protein
MLGSMQACRDQSSNWRLFAALVAALALAGCPTSRRPDAPSGAPEAAPSSAAPVADQGFGAPPADARRYTIDSGASLIVIVARRGGTLASVGHNHVIASRNLLGVIDVRAPLTASSFAFRMPVELLTVDEPQLREGRGPDFPPDVPDSAREGTRTNMLGPDLLDGVRYPAILAQSVSLEGGPAEFSARVAFTVRNVRHEVTVPLRVALQGDAVRVTGQFTVTQTELGLKPFSVMLGALKVEDALGVEVDLLARATTGT